MNQFINPKTFKANPSNYKKKLALAAFLIGAGAFTLAVTGVIGTANGGPFFAGGIVGMAFAFRFWNRQVRCGPTAVTFATAGVTIANRSTSTVIAWADLESIRYRAWKGGHYWEFKTRSRKESVGFYMDGLTWKQLEAMRETVASIKLPNVLIQPFYTPFGFKPATA